MASIQQHCPLPVIGAQWPIAGPSPYVGIAISRHRCVADGSGKTRHLRARSTRSAGRVTADLIISGAGYRDQFWAINRKLRNETGQ